MDTIKTILVDDEPLARKRIRSLLANEPDFEIVGECEDGGQAVLAIEKLEPDLVFLDVQMPEINGFDVIASIGVDQMPLIIFVTAYDRYAVEAFEVHAMDYILKPFDRERFLESLDRVRGYVRKTEGTPFQAQLAELINEVKSKQQTHKQILVKSGGRILFIPKDDIDWIEAAGNYMRIHTASETYLMRETMSGMESRLDPYQFVRIHRSTIVNFDRIREMEPAFNGEFSVILHGEKILKLSRKYRARLEKRLGKPL